MIRHTIALLLTASVLSAQTSQTSSARDTVPCAITTSPDVTRRSVTLECHAAPTSAAARVKKGDTVLVLVKRATVVPAPVVTPAPSPTPTPAPAPTPAPTPGSTTIVSADFENGSFAPFTNPWADSSIFVINDPTGSGTHGKVVRLQYATVNATGADANRALSLSLPYNPTTFAGTGIGLGQTLTFSGDYFIPAVVPGTEAAIRKLLYWQPDRCCYTGAHSFYTVLWQEGDGLALEYGFTSDSMAFGQTHTTNRLPTKVPFAQWHHVALSITMNSAANKRDGRVSLAIDGVSVLTDTTASWTDPGWSDAASSVFFGALLVGDQVNFNLPFNELRYWDNITFTRSAAKAP